MKHLREKEIDRTDNRWCRIYYITRSGYGSYIIKMNVLENNQKKFDKLLKDCVSVGIDADYHINMYDIIESALRMLPERIQYHERMIHWLRNEIDSEDYRYHKSEIIKLLNKQLRLERMLAS